MKSGAFNLISKKFNLRKLHPNTHFYTSEEKNQNFPGRILSIESIDPKAVEKGGKYNIISKNYPLSPDEIKKKYKISDGGKTYLIFTQSQNGKNQKLTELTIEGCRGNHFPAGRVRRGQRPRRLPEAIIKP